MGVTFFVMFLVSFMALTIQVELQSALGWVIFGTDSGQILKCHYNFPDKCEEFHRGDSMVRSIVVHGEYVFAAHDSKKIVRCYWHKKNSCKNFAGTESRVLRLAVIDGYLYVGEVSGILKRCELNVPNSCETMQKFPDNSIFSINSYNNFIYISLRDQIYYCTKKDLSCLKIKASEKLNIHQVAIMSNTMIVIPRRPQKDYNVTFYDLLSPNTIAYRNNVTIPGIYRQSFRIEAFKRKIYILLPTGDVMVSDEGFTKFKLFVRNENAITFSFAYGTHHMVDQFSDEDTQCAESRPSGLFNYDVNHRALLEVSVVDGLLRDARGATVDTRGADLGRSARAAVFAMGPDGQLLLSTAHRSRLVHISSLLAGGPVAGAGEMQVEDGVVKRIVACSQLYWPDVQLNRQVVDELHRRGCRGADDIILEECDYTCDRD